MLGLVEKMKILTFASKYDLCSKELKVFSDLAPRSNYKLTIFMYAGTEKPLMVGCGVGKSTQHLLNFHLWSSERQRY